MELAVRVRHLTGAPPVCSTWNIRRVRRHGPYHLIFRRAQVVPGIMQGPLIGEHNIARCAGTGSIDDDPADGGSTAAGSNHSGGWRFRCMSPIVGARREDVQRKSTLMFSTIARPHHARLRTRSTEMAKSKGSNNRYRHTRPILQISGRSTVGSSASVSESNSRTRIAFLLVLVVGPWTFFAVTGTLSAIAY